MKQFARLFIVALMASLPFVGISGLAVAQDMGKDAKAAPAAPAAKAEKGRAVQKVLIDNDKVRVFELTFQPGDQGALSNRRPDRVTRILKGGTILRTYDDGTTEQLEWETGAVTFAEADSQAFTLKNVGKTDVALYVVFLKEPKK